MFYIIYLVNGYIKKKQICVVGKFSIFYNIMHIYILYIILINLYFNLCSKLITIYIIYLVFRIYSLCKIVNSKKRLELYYLRMYKYGYEYEISLYL